MVKIRRVWPSPARPAIERIGPTRPGSEENRADTMTTRRFLLLGAGDLAREVATILVQSGETSATPCEIAAFSDVAGTGPPAFERCCHSFDAALRDFPPSDWQAVGCVGNPRVREAMYHRFRDAGYRFATVCHPDATQFADQLGPGCIVFPGARLAIGCRLEEDVVVNFNATVGHDTLIGAHSVIAPGVQLGGRISGGKRVVFGIGSSVLQGRRIGDDAVIGAGSSVWTDVSAGATMVGVPAAVRKIPGRTSAPAASSPGQGN
jgi:sugar O-acyltransferase (sialic acid O-acetyltransferase NeuD family)